MGPRWRALRGALLGDGLPIVVERVEHPIPYNNSLRSDRLRVYRPEISAHADYRQRLELLKLRLRLSIAFMLLLDKYLMQPKALN